MSQILNGGPKSENNIKYACGDWSFDLLGPVGEKLIRPVCVSVAMTGEFVVSDADSCFIVIYSSTGHYISHFSTISKRTFYIFFDPGTYAPHDVAWLSNKRIVHTQPKGCRVIISDWKGNYSVEIEGKPLYQPYGVCVDASDRIYITDKHKGRVLCFSSEGKLIKGIAIFGSCQTLSHPHYISVSENGDVYVSEYNEGKLTIKVFQSSGTTRNILIPKDCKSHEHMNVGNFVLVNGNILQTDRINSYIYVCQGLKGRDDFESDTEEHSIIKFNSLSNIALTENNLVFIDQYNKQLHILSIVTLL